MKRNLHIVLLLALSLAFTGCSLNVQSLKVADPAEREALRTRSDSCSIDSLSLSSAVGTAFSVLDMVKPKVLWSDIQTAEDAATAEKLVGEAKEVFLAVRDRHTDGYSPWLTLYSILSVLAIMTVMIVMTVKAIRKR